MASARCSLTLNLIGGFELLCDGEVQDLPEASKRVVAFLGLHAKPQTRLYVAGSLWPEKPETRASANLRSALWRLNEPGQPELVHSDGVMLSLRDTVELDVRWLREVGWKLLDGSAHDAAADADAVNRLLAWGVPSEKDVLFDELLPGWYEDWVLLERERLAELQVHLLDLVVGALVVEQRFPQAIDMALRMVALDPYRERSQLALIRAYLAEGSRGRARRQYDTFDQLLQMSFGQACETSFNALCERTPC